MVGTENDFLRRAIELARIARDKGQEPFGAVLVRDEKIVGESYNKIYELSDPTAHAEINLIKEFCQSHGTMKLEGYTIFCRTEPCIMCCGAILLSKISRLVFSVPQEKLHAISGGKKKPDYRTLLGNSNSNIEIVGSLLLEEGLLVFQNYTFRKNRT